MSKSYTNEVKDKIVELYLKDSYVQALKACDTDLRAICIVSQLHVHSIEKAPVDVAECEKICQSLGAKFRNREWLPKGY